MDTSIRGSLLIFKDNVRPVAVLITSEEDLAMVPRLSVKPPPIVAAWIEEVFKLAENVEGKFVEGKF